MISFQILGLQEQMIKEGKLKSQADFDHFWMEMKKPEIFHSYFPGMLILSRYIGFDHFDFLICGYFSEYLLVSELFFTNYWKCWQSLYSSLWINDHNIKTFV